MKIKLSNIPGHPHRVTVGGQWTDYVRETVWGENSLYLSAGDLRPVEAFRNGMRCLVEDIADSSVIERAQAEVRSALHAGGHW